MFRGFAPIAVCALAVVLGGCDWTSMTASDMREPVLLGPVACIGCAAKPPDRTGAPASHIGAHRHTEVRVEYFWVYASGVAAESHPIGVDLDRVMYWTPCTDDVHLSKVRARAWQTTIPLFYFRSDVSVEADATPIPVPGGKCPPLR